LTTNEDSLPNKRRPQPVSRTFKLGRKTFLGLTGLTAAGLLITKKAIPDLTFVTGVASVNGFTLYTVTNGYPSFSANGYRLTIDGLVNKPLTLTIDEILRMPSVTETRFYQCVTGWAVPNAKWTGIRLSSLLDAVQPHANAHALTLYSFDGTYTESLTMQQARHSDVLLAYKLMDQPLSRAQGAPLRLVVPGMELVPKPVDGYWERNGYDRDAYIGASNGA
jgi:DMSO/TMAO reductase YedYZ molybdopterin-dependent catalytic subunit